MAQSESLEGQRGSGRHDLDFKLLKQEFLTSVWRLRSVFAFQDSLSPSCLVINSRSRRLLPPKVQEGKNESQP